MEFLSSSISTSTPNPTITILSSSATVCPTEIEPVRIISIDTEPWYELVLRINWFVLLTIILLFGFGIWLIKNGRKKSISRRQINIEGISLGLTDFSISISCGNEVQEIAYQLWIELVTRKIAVPLDDNDFIIEVYNSWYSAFATIRELLKTIPGKSLNVASPLVLLTIKVLNDGLRPHLSKWQAKYRVWYEHEAKNTHEPPQVIQQNYPFYQELIADMKVTNQNMITFANKLHDIAFGEQKQNKPWLGVCHFVNNEDHPG